MQADQIVTAFTPEGTESLGRVASALDRKKRVSVVDAVGRGDFGGLAVWPQCF